MSLGLPWNWNASDAEIAARYPCDDGPPPQHRFYRAIDVAAPAAVTYRWLQQLRIAPYSYDWADNFCLPSPARLTPRADRIAVGERVMHLFTITALEPGRSLSARIDSRLGAALFGKLAGTYVVSARDERTSRLFVKVNATYPRGAYGRAIGGVMPWIDWLMTRRQLQRLAGFAEKAASLPRS